MHKFLSGLALAALLVPPVAAQETGKPLTPSDIVAAAPAADWVRIAPADLVVMDLAPDAHGKARRVVIQLMLAPFSQGWVANVRKLVAARWYDGIAVVRVQDNYVVQWGDPDGEDPKKAKGLPKGLERSPETGYLTPFVAGSVQSRWEHGRHYKAVTVRSGHLFLPPPAAPDMSDPYATSFSFAAGFPVAMTTLKEETPTVITVRPDQMWPIHCYGMVGVGRNLSPDTGSGAELYAVIGTPPRQLDRNIALVGRVIAGIEHLSSLPRGTGPLGFYETPDERVPIVSARMGDEVHDLPAYEYLSTESASFAAYADKRANRQDDFYIRPAGGVDVCNVPVPVRVAGGEVTRVGM
ncbi:peptidylprolyl isomerase [Novosphingobium colocasiae]|uniref:peptidylprolyl isomerase n=1 Tax=Novosphingobium colocasiae TaxID=1256513 RepID=UPI0035B27210